MISIGKFKLDTRVFLAPMAGITSFPFRELNRKHGCGFAFLEMVNARSLSYSNRKTLDMMRSDENDRPLGVQLLGAEPDFILRALDKLKTYKFDILDFNAACPQKKITSRGEGASLLKDPKKLKGLLKIMVKNTDKPVTVKIRTGWDNSFSAADTARYCRDAGINAVFVHGRTMAQGYSGVVDYEAIKKVKKAVDIPVIASGDVFTPRLAGKMFDETGCDGIAVARGALGNPWIFREISEFFKKGRVVPRPDKKEIIAAMKSHLDLNCDFFGEKNGILIFRKFYIWYTRGFVRVHDLRRKANKIHTKKEMIELIAELGRC
jgi:tRNA-dihydrouridine synthase B